MQSGTKPQSSWVILVCAWLMGFALEIPLFCVPPVMHIITDELRLSHAQSGLIFSVRGEAGTKNNSRTGTTRRRIEISRQNGIAD